MGEPDEIYDMADDDSNVDTDSVVSPKDFIKRLNAQNRDMAAHKGAPPKIALKPPVLVKDIKKLQGALKPVDDVQPKKSPAENNRYPPNKSSESAPNELAAKFAARRKFGEDGEPIKNVESIAEALAKALPEFEKKIRSQSESASNSSNVDVKKPVAVRPVEVHVAHKTVDAPHKRPPAPLPKKVALPPSSSSKPDKPALASPTSKQDSNNNLHNEINKRKSEYKFEIITHEGAQYLAYKLPIVEGTKPRKPFRTADIIVPAKYSPKKTKPISVIEPTASDEEEDEVKPPPRPVHPHPPPVHIKGLPLTSTVDDDGMLYEDTEVSAPIPEEEDGEIYEQFEQDEVINKKEKPEEQKRQEEKLEKQRLKEEKRRLKELEKEKKRKQKEEQEKQKIKEKYKLDGTERVQFCGKAKDKISRVFETLFEKGDDVPVVRVDEKVNPKGKWLVQLKDGKYEYLDMKLIEREQKPSDAPSATDYDEENIYEGEEYDDAFSGTAAVVEEDIYEEM